MISYQTEGIEMPAIKKRETTEWIKKVAADYGKRVGEIAYSSFQTWAVCSRQQVSGMWHSFA